MIRKNENGYTLLLTLAIILIITSFIGTLSFLTLNQQTQVENTDEDFLLSDITEMGIEYYRSRVFEDYVRVIKQVEKNINEELNNFPEKYVTKKEVEDLEIEKELEGIRDLKAILCTDEARANLCAYEVKAIPIEEPKLTFSLIESPYEFESTERYLQFKFLIEGSNSVNQEKYSFNIRLPKNFVDLSITNPVNGNGSIDYSKTIKYPVFTPPLDTKYCKDVGESNKCISQSNELKNNEVKKLDNLTVYFTGDVILNNPSNTTFNSTLIIDEGNFTAGNLIKVDFLSIFVKGDIIIDQLKNKSIVNLFSTQTISFTKHVDLLNSKIRSLGNLNVKNDSEQAMTISNTHILLEGKDNYIQSLHAKENSIVCIKDDTNIEKLYIDESSFVYILDTVPNFEYNLGSESEKLPIIINEGDFKEKCYGIGTSDEIEVNVETEVEITAESILNEIDYDLID